MMKNISRKTIPVVVFILCARLVGGAEFVFSQEPAESLNLPEVVITGTDQSKIQRDIPGIPAAQTPLVFIDSASHDASDALLSEGRLLAFVRPQRAEELYRQALVLDPENHHAYLLLGDVFRAQNKNKAAAAAYVKALELSENLSEAHYQLGILYESRLQDTAQAMKHYQAYLKVGGSDKRVRIWLRNLERREQPQEQMPTSVSSTFD